MLRRIRWWLEDIKISREERLIYRANMRAGKSLGQDFIEACERNFERERRRGIAPEPEVQAGTELLLRKLDGKRPHDA